MLLLRSTIINETGSPAAGEGGGGGKRLVSRADICPASTADISIRPHHSASTCSIYNEHLIEAATAADFWLP